MISIEVNGQKFELKDGSNLKDAIDISKALYIPGTTIGIFKAGMEKKEATSEYKIFTTKGEFRIELTGDTTLWTKSSHEFAGIKAHWETSNSIAFGPFETDLIPERTARKFNRFDVFFGTGGYDAKNSYLLISRDKHTTDYGGPREAVVAKVISGKSIITKLRQSDSIIRIEPVIKWETLHEKASTNDLLTVLEEGMRIFTYFKVDLSDESPEGAEHFLALIRKKFFKVDTFSNSFISDDELKGEGCVYEHWDARSEGSVATRTDGLGNGRIYIYKEDRTSSAVHSVAGMVSQGIELIKIAPQGSSLAVISNPERIMILGTGFDTAEKMLSARGIKLEKRGYTGEDAIIVEQEPDTTIEIIKEGMVTGLGVKSEQIIDVRFYYDLAPATLDFFRHSLRLKDRPLGPLPLVYTYENTFLFKSEKEAEAYKEINPENVPKTKIMAGDIGVTNQAAKRYGMIGVKLISDEKYGPTGEKFECTNIIGKVIDPNRLKGFKAGDVVYIREV
ncbi:MAG: methanogenesis marker 3 protein [Candidatus Methanoperedens sp.]|nr:methanogenesis marker 3 protein [Candidatus Methanoperedens sp.]MCE8424942.1 methanogenesis marker 3 protein [Candidatus Methanoperedens sp.]MCE8427454.1 methanogenesis marker 3 protein [Candidatus Methanoperedens sp.]